MAKKDSIGIREKTDEWKLYEQGIEYNHSLSPDYYATVNRNWRVYNLQHLDHINSGGLPKPKIPMSQRVTRQSVAACMTKSVKMNYTLENVSDDTKDESEQEQKQLSALLSKNSVEHWEKLKMPDMIRKLLLNGANEGDFAAHTYWDPTIDTGQAPGIEYLWEDKAQTIPTIDETTGQQATRPVPILGEFCTEIVDGANVFFGNPNDTRVNFNGKPFQPYIILAGREVVAKLRKEAKLYQKENGLTDDEIEALIIPDRDTEEQTGDRGKKELENGSTPYGKATYLIKYWVDDDGNILFNKSLKNCVIRKDVVSDLTIYPIAWGNWDTIKNSYHGQALMTGLVENQLELDKSFARLFKYLADMAFPKAIYNKSYFPNGVTNKIGDAIGYEAGENIAPDNVLKYTQPGQIANNVIDIISIFMSKTMDLLGSSDSVLGSANPENTSAILANAQYAAVPLENVKANLYQFIEDLGYIWLDFMLHKYKVTRKIAVDNQGIRQLIEFDPAKLAKSKFRIKVDVISGGYIDEFTSAQAMQNLFLKGAIDVVDYIERLPEGTIPEREKLIEKLNEKIKQQQAMQTEQFKMAAVQEYISQIKGQPQGGANAGSPMQ